MDRGEVISCNPFSGHLGNHGNSARDSLCTTEDSLLAGVSDPHSPTSIISEGYNSCTSAVYDDYFEVNDDEEVKTPRTSPTLEELRKLLSSIRSSSKLSLRKSLIIDLPKSDTLGFVTKSLSDVARRTCQYPLDKYYDEAIPLHSFRVLTKDDKSADKSASISRSTAAHIISRRLENVKHFSTSTIPRQTSYSSSSGSLIVVMGDGMQSMFSPSFSSSLDLDCDTSHLDKSLTSTLTGNMLPTGKDLAALHNCPVEANYLSLTKPPSNLVRHSTPVSPDAFYDIQSMPKSQGPIHHPEDASVATNASATKNEPSVHSGRRCANSQVPGVIPSDCPVSAKPDLTSSIPDVMDGLPRPSEDIPVGSGPSPTSLVDTVTTTTPAIQVSSSRAAVSLTSSVPEYFYADSGSADEEFTLVTDKRQRRKQKRQSKANNGMLTVPQINRANGNSAIPQKPSFALKYTPLAATQRPPVNRFLLPPSRNGASTAFDRTKVGSFNQRPYSNQSLIRLPPFSHDSSSNSSSAVSEKSGMVERSSCFHCSRSVSGVLVPDRTTALSVTCNNARKLNLDFNSSAPLPLPNTTRHALTSGPRSVFCKPDPLTHVIAGPQFSGQHERLIKFLLSSWDLFTKQYTNA